MSESGTNNYLCGHKLIFVSLDLALCIVMPALDFTITIVSLPYISGGLEVNTFQGTWLVTTFTLGNAVTLLMSPWLTKRFGSVKVLLTSLISFIFFSFCCGAAPTFIFLLVARVLQGLAAGPIISIAHNLLVAYSPPKRKDKHRINISPNA